MPISAVRRSVVFSLSFIAALFVAVAAWSQPADGTIELVVQPGRTMRVAIDHRVTIHHLGQPVTGTLVEPVYVYDRIVLPIGARLTGHIERLEHPSKSKRTLAMIGGDFSPHQHAILLFDSIAGPDSQAIRIVTTVKGGSLRPRRRVAKSPNKAPEDQPSSGRIAETRQAISEQAHEALALLKDPGKMERLEQMAIDQLPYHPEFIAKGMVYDVELLEPVSFGRATSVAEAPPGSLPAPDSILTAKIAATIDSAKATRGAPIAAVLTQPVFSARHELVLPEGTRLTGEVTQAKAARRWRRNGQLRIMFTAMQPPAQMAHPLLASLYSVESGAQESMTVDEEGGASITNSKARFIPPALAILAVRGSAHQEHELDQEHPGQIETQNSPGARALGGFFGFGAIGAIVGPFSRPVAIAVSVAGATRTIYRSVLAKGREVTFSADTPIEVRLAPGPSPVK
jgi:hypothetical protein